VALSAGQVQALLRPAAEATTTGGAEPVHDAARAVIE
jgi:hypothetical protein